MNGPFTTEGEQTTDEVGMKSKVRNCWNYNRENKYHDKGCFYMCA